MPDTFMPDAFMSDTGMSDTGMSDTGMSDTGMSDTGMSDTGMSTTRMSTTRRLSAIGLTMVKNEQDIIEPMLRHNGGLLDALIVLDNGSVDATRDIALSVARELGNIVVTDSPGFGYTQGERITRLLHAAQSGFFADYVLFLDADEFIGAANGTAPSRAMLEANLERIPLGGFGAMEWRNYVLTEDTPAGAPPDGFSHRREVENIQAVKSILRLDGAILPDLVVGRGSHNVTRGGNPLPGVMLPDLPLWHFPIRSERQLTAKALVGWLACLAANPHAAKSRESYHWGDMYERIVAGRGFSGAELRTLSMNYGDLTYSMGLPQPPDPPLVRDVPAIASSRRYSTGAYLDPLILLARSWEQTLRARDPLFAPEEASNETIDIPPFRWLTDKYRPESALVLYPGTGLTIEMLRRLGVPDLAGVGTLAETSLVMRRGGYVRHDPAAGFSLSRAFALVLCLGVPAGVATGTLAANLVRHAGEMIGFRLEDSSATALGGFLGHLQGLGWIPDLFETQAVRCLASSARLRRGLVILRRAGTPGMRDGTAALLAIARRPYQPASQAPCVYEEPLRDEAESGWLGYAPGAYHAAMTG